MRLQLTFASVLLTIGWTLGAPDGVDPAKPKDRTDHWSFKPLAKFKVDQNIDAFIKEKLIANGLSMSPASDRLTWIRRVYFDLIGLFIVVYSVWSV